MFTSFDLPPVRGSGTEIRFKVALSSLLECLSVYGADKLPLTAAHVAYAEDDGKLNLLLEAHGVTTECQLATADYARGDDTDHEAAFRCERGVRLVWVWNRGIGGPNVGQQDSCGRVTRGEHGRGGRSGACNVRRVR